MKCVFLDRDGTINIDYGYVGQVERFELIPRADEALKLLQDNGFMLIVVTNQSGIGVGKYTENDFVKVTKHLNELLAEKDIKITETYHCPHHPETGCHCRKPNPHQIKLAVDKYNINISESYLVGDKTQDIQFGKNSNLTTILVQTGKAGKDGVFDVKPDFVAKDLYEAALWIVNHEQQNKNKRRD